MKASNPQIRALTKQVALFIPPVRHLYGHLQGVRHDLTTAWAALDSLSHEKAKMAENLTTAWAALDRLSQEKEKLAEDLTAAWSGLGRISAEMNGMAGQLTEAWAALKTLSSEKDAMAIELAAAQAKLADAARIEQQTPGHNASDARDEKLLMLRRAWQATSNTYGRWLAGATPEHPEPVLAESLDKPAHPLLNTWVDFRGLREARALPYRPTFEFPGPYLNQSHAALADAPVGRMGIESLIDLGVDGFLLPEDALKLYEMAFCSNGDLLEIGTHQGLSTSILAQALHEAAGKPTLETIDIDATAQAKARETLATRAGIERISFILKDATHRVQELVQVGRQFGFVFVDHWHGYQATHDVSSRLGFLLRTGGFALFHDFVNPWNADPDHVYGVYQAVMDTLCSDDRFLFYGNFGCCSLWRKVR